MTMAGPEAIGLAVVQRRLVTAWKGITGSLLLKLSAKLASQPRFGDNKAAHSPSELAIMYERSRCAASLRIARCGEGFFRETTNPICTAWG